MRSVFIRFLAASAALGVLFFLLPAAEEQGVELGWPREIDTPKVTIVIYQPQADSLVGNRLTGRAALMLKPKEKGPDGKEREPIFGVFWVEARISTDRDARLVTLHELKVTRVRFPDITDEQERKFADLVGPQIKQWYPVFSLDALTTSLAAAREEQAAAANLKMDPPKIIVTTESAVLVQINGEPIIRPIKDTRLERVVNTPFLMVFDPKTKLYWLNAGYVWYRSPQVKGDWKIAAPPADIGELAPEEAVAEAGLERPQPGTKMPRVIVETEPSELISIDGKPNYKPLAGNELLYVTNTEDDVLLDVASQRHFIILSGRWYASGSLTRGPWTYVRPDQLPPAFAQIPAESDKGHLRAHVAGTEEALDAIMDSQIPQTAAVERKGATVEVEYDGKPQFKPVENTSMQYAENTDSSVLKIGDMYYVAEQGVWFRSRKPDGPWELADSVPDEVQKIPPSNPNYTVKYVYVYDSTPDVVYVGYTPAYTGCYPYQGSVVYGTGWWYHPWVSPHHYYARPWSFGFHVRYNPWTGGWGFGFSFGYGPFSFSFGWGSGWYGGPWWGARPGWWRPAGYWGGYRHGFAAGYWAGRRHGYAHGRWGGARPVHPVTRPYRANRMLHNPRALAAVRSRDVNRLARSNIYSRPSARARINAQTRVPRTDRSRVARTYGNNVFADRNGNVYRRTERGWERREGRQWRPATGAPGSRDRIQPGQSRPATRDRVQPGQTRPTTRDRVQPGQTRPATRPSTSRVQPTTRQRPSAATRPSSSRSRLDREYRARQRTSQRTRNYQRSRTPRSRPAMRAPRMRRR